MERITEKPLLVIAGPGAGKTFNMVGEIARVISDLRPNRVLATITYTNAATEMIKGDLQKVMQLPPNIFVGTNYSFFNQFILLPYATIYGHVALDKLFLDIDVDGIVENRIGHTNRDNFALKNKVRSSVVAGLLHKGKVPFRQIVKVSADLIQQQRVRHIVCSRLQYLFIDEFQDTDTLQLAIFDEIRKGQRTKIYAVGDPEQYILSFAYEGKKPRFNNIPINRFSAQRQILTENRRSSSAIVDFANSFHTEITQTAIKGNDDHSFVYFFVDTDLDFIIAKFRELTQVLEGNNTPVTRFYVAYENKTFGDCAAKYGLVSVANDRSKPRSLLDESLKLLSAIIGLNQNQVCNKYKLDQLGYRKMGIRLLKAIQNGTVKDVAQAISFIKGTLNLQPDSDFINAGEQFLKLQSLICKEEVSSWEQHGSIHKVKGLEADAVLVVARTENELQKWLTTDKQERCEDTNDTCRIGFVAFTRAKRILCIACKHKISDGLKDRLLQLGVKPI